MEPPQKRSEPRPPLAAPTPLTGIPMSLLEEHRQLLEVAAVWSLVIKEENTPENRRAFDQWLTKSPDHVHAFLVVDPSLEQAREYIVMLDESMTLAANQTDIRVAPRSLPADAPENLHVTESSQLPRALFWGVLKASAGISAVAASVLFIWFAVHRDLPTGDSRAKGQHQPRLANSSQIIDSFGIYNLSENSLMRLAAHSRVRVTPLADEPGNEVSVIEGVAYFSGQHGPRERLLITSGRITVDVEGTSLEVSNKDGQTGVYVFDGKVKLTRCPPDTDAPARSLPTSFDSNISLTGNQSVSLASEECSGHIEIRPVRNAPQPAQSEEEWLVFNGTPVPVAAEMFNRANIHCLVIADDSVAHKRIGGSFRASDLDGFLTVLKVLGVSIIREAAPTGTTVVRLAQK